MSAVSLWLNAGVPATQVAEWAGHSVHVLLKVYAKWIDGQDESARRRVEAALNMSDDLAPMTRTPAGSWSHYGRGERAGTSSIEIARD